MQQKQQHLAEGRSLKHTLLIPGSIDTLVGDSDTLAQIRVATSKVLGLPCSLHLVNCCTFDAPISLLVVTCRRDTIIAVYELSDFCDQVKCKRVCDVVVRGMLALHGEFPGIPTVRLQPVNMFGGSHILPSGRSPDHVLGFI